MSSAVNEVIECCKLSAIKIYAETAKEQLFNVDVSSNFAELYEKCCVLRILCEWDEIRESSLEEVEKLNAEFKDDEFFVPVQYVSNGDEIAFIKIIQKEPSEITHDDKVKAFRLFPKVITNLGVE